MCVCLCETESECVCVCARVCVCVCVCVPQVHELILSFCVCGAAPLRASSFVPSCLGVRTEACRSTCVSSQSSLLSPVRSERRKRTKCELSMRGASETIRTPASIGEMMKDAGSGVLAALNKGVKRMAVEVPLPITGGTELDDCECPTSVSSAIRVLLYL